MSAQHPYTAEHVKLYLEGKLSAAEMHAIEKAAMDDPFLADAIEGMEIMKETKGLEHFDTQTNELKTRLKERISGKKNSKLFSIYGGWWKAAAVLIVIVTGLAVVLIMNEKNEVKPAIVAKNEDKVTTRQHETVLLDSSKRDTIEQLSTAISSRKRSLVKKQLPTPDTETPSRPQTNDMQVQSDQKDIAFQAPSAKEDSFSSASASPKRALSGKVAGVEVEPQETVVVTSKGLTKNSSPKNASKNVEPEGGWASFESYIDSGKAVAAPDSALHGPVALRFNIDRNGRPAAISISTSLSPAHDEQAVRLIQNGPSWKVLKGRSRKVTLLIDF